MIHKILPVGPLHCNCSIIGDEATHEAMVIDPGDDIDDVLAMLREHKLQVKQIVITHAHIDHVGGAMKLRAQTGAPILLNQSDYALLKMLDLQATWVGMAAPGEVAIEASISDGEKLQTGALTANVMHTPGHTEGSVCLYFPAEKLLIAGDTLFARSIGRTDLPGGSYEKIMRSLTRPRHDTARRDHRDPRAWADDDNRRGKRREPRNPLPSHPRIDKTDILFLFWRLVLRNSRRRGLRFRLRWFHPRHHRCGASSPCCKNRQRDRRQHKNNRRPSGCPGKNGSRASRAKRRLATLAAKGGSQVAALPTLKQYDGD